MSSHPAFDDYLAVCRDTDPTASEAVLVDRAHAYLRIPGASVERAATILAQRRAAHLDAAMEEIASSRQSARAARTGSTAGLYVDDELGTCHEIALARVSAKRPWLYRGVAGDPEVATGRRSATRGGGGAVAREAQRHGEDAAAAAARTAAEKIEFSEGLVAGLRAVFQMPGATRDDVIREARRRQNEQRRA